MKSVNRKKERKLRNEYVMKEKRCKIGNHFIWRNVKKGRLFCKHTLREHYTDMKSSKRKHLNINKLSKKERRLQFVQILKNLYDFLNMTRLRKKERNKKWRKERCMTLTRTQMSRDFVRDTRRNIALMFHSSSQNASIHACIFLCG